MLNLERLRVLNAIATHGSVQAAADSLDVSPSAVSQQIAKLEQEVGQPLLVRSGRGIRLTDTAQLLAARASTLLDAVEKLEGDLDDLHGNVAGTITITAFPTAARGLGPRLVQQLHAAYPNLIVSIHEEEPTTAIPALSRGETDIVIGQDWSNSPVVLPNGLTKQHLFNDIVDIALPKDHRLAKRREITFKQLADQPWVSWPPGSTCGDWLIHTYRTNGNEPRVAHIVGEHTTQLAFVEAGLGAAVIPRLGRPPVPEGVKLVRSSPTFHRSIFAAWRTNNAQRSNITAVKQVLTKLKP